MKLVKVGRSHKVAEASFDPSSPPSSPLIEWLTTEILDDYGAIIDAREHAEWNRLRYLEGHKAGLLAVVHHIRAEQHNEKGKR